MLNFGQDVLLILHMLNLFRFDNAFDWHRFQCIVTTTITMIDHLHTTECSWKRKSILFLLFLAKQNLLSLPVPTVRIASNESKVNCAWFAGLFSSSFIIANSSLGIGDWSKEACSLTGDVTLFFEDIRDGFCRVDGRTIECDFFGGELINDAEGRFKRSGSFELLIERTDEAIWNSFWSKWMILNERKVRVDFDWT